jgi:hypothetical protein
MDEHYLADLTNRYCVTANERERIIILPVSTGIVQPNDALLLAAWLAVIAQPLTATSFESVLASVRKLDSLAA